MPVTATPDPSSSASQTVSASTPPPDHTQPTEAPRKAGVLDAVRTIRPGDFNTFYQKPCARESLLTGIGAGFAIGGLRFVLLWNKAPTATSGTQSTAGSAANTAPKQVSSDIGELTKDASRKFDAVTPRRRPPPAGTTIPSNMTLGARAWRSMTWAVLSFTLFSAGAHIFCQRQRALERAAMERAAEIVARKREEKRVELLRKREEREARRREHEAQKAERSRWGRWFGGGGNNSPSSTGKPGNGSV